MAKSPTEQTNLRLDAAIKARAKAAADDLGLDLARLVERALVAYLATDSEMVAIANPDSNTLASDSINAAIADLAARVEALETKVLATDSKVVAPPLAPKSDAPLPAPKQPRQNRQQGASKLVQVSEHPPGEGLTVGQALIAAGAEISEAHAMGSNYDSRMVTRYGMKAAPWLEAQGWVKAGRKWYPPGHKAQ